MGHFVWNGFKLTTDALYQKDEGEDSSKVINKVSEKRRWQNTFFRILSGTQGVWWSTFTALQRLSSNHLPVYSEPTILVIIFLNIIF